VTSECKWEDGERSGMPSHTATFRWRNCTVSMRWTQSTWGKEEREAAEEVVASFPAQLYRHPALTPHYTEIVPGG
jgi:hypothetical protein